MHDVSKEQKALPNGTVERAEPDTLTIEETAKRLRIGLNSEYASVKLGDIPSIRIGRRLLVPRAALEALLAAGEPIERTGSSRPVGYLQEALANSSTGLDLARLLKARMGNLRRRAQRPNRVRAGVGRDEGFGGNLGAGSEQEAGNQSALHLGCIVAVATEQSDFFVTREEVLRITGISKRHSIRIFRELELEGLISRDPRECGDREYFGARRYRAACSSWRRRARFAKRREATCRLVDCGKGWMERTEAGVSWGGDGCGFQRLP